jgi:hypothetical protein
MRMKEEYKIYLIYLILLGLVLGYGLLTNVR